MTPSSLDAGFWVALCLGSALKITVILAAAWLAWSLLRSQPAALRHAVWAAGIASALLLPVLSMALPDWAPEVLPQPALLEALRAAAVSGDSQPPLPSMAIFAADGALGPMHWRVWLLAVWLAGFGVAALRLLAGAVRLAGLIRLARPLRSPWCRRLLATVAGELGLRRRVRLLQSRGASMPMSWGVLRPGVLLPRGAQEWPPERMRIVLAHELAHIRRSDWPVQILAEVARALYWFHPLVWVACNRLRRESEHACDDTVLNAGLDAPRYAEHLLDLACDLGGPGNAWSVALAMARPSSLERRFIAMFNSTVNRRHVTQRARLAAAATVLCLTLPLAALRLPAQATGGKFAGTVFDESGGVVQNATVIVSNPAARTKDMTTTNQLGVYEFSGLAPGQYTLEVLKEGFARFQKSGITLPSGQDVRLDVKLQLGAVTEQVNVTAKGQAKTSPTAAAAPVRVGGGVQATKLIRMARPVYPPKAKEAGIEGSVLLEGIVGTDGRFVSLRVMNSQIDPDLAKAAVEAVNQWRYQPTLLNGVPVEVITQITVNFRLAE